MIWKKLPTEPGWHWYLQTHLKALGYRTPTPIEIKYDEFTRQLLAWFPGYPGGQVVKEYPHIIWAGPMIQPTPPPPSEVSDRG